MRLEYPSIKNSKESYRLSYQILLVINNKVVVCVMERLLALEQRRPKAKACLSQSSVAECNKSLHNSNLLLLTIMWVSWAVPLLVAPELTHGAAFNGNVWGLGGLPWPHIHVWLCLGTCHMASHTRRCMVVLVTGAENNLWTYLIYLTS